MRTWKGITYVYYEDTSENELVKVEKSFNVDAFDNVRR